MSGAEKHSEIDPSTDVASTSLAESVETALRDLPRLPRDSAAVDALRLYAALLDDAVDRLGDAAEDDQARDFARMVNAVSKIGPRFERMIDMLGMAPGSRPTAPKDPHAGGDPQDDFLEKLRKELAQGVSPPASLHPALEGPDAFN